jgi:hypothetical protein
VVVADGLPGLGARSPYSFEHGHQPGVDSIETSALQLICQEEEEEEEQQQAPRTATRSSLVLQWLLLLLPPKK